MRKYKHQLKGKLKIAWKPIYDLCQTIFVKKRFLYNGQTFRDFNFRVRLGDDVFASVWQSVFGFVYKSSHHFPENCVDDIWDMVKDEIRSTQNPESFIALGWLYAFFPSQVQDFMTM